MKVYAVSDIGMRNENQDSYWVAKIAVSDPGSTSNLDNLGIGGGYPKGVSEGSIICVCDGMGGLDDGSYASRTTIEHVRYAVRGGNIDVETLSAAIEEANSKLYRLGKDRGKRLGTTCTIVILLDGQYRIIHVGDSRCYRIGHDNIYRVLTEDHTAFEKFRNEGVMQWVDDRNVRINGKTYRAGSLRSKLTRSVGVREGIDLEVYQGGYVKGDMFLVSSDGFWHSLDSDNRWPIMLRRASNKEEYLRSLMAQFKNRNEKDNLTVAMAVV